MQGDSSFRALRHRPQQRGRWTGMGNSGTGSDIVSWPLLAHRIQICVGTGHFCEIVCVTDGDNRAWRRVIGPVDTRRPSGHRVWRDVPLWGKPYGSGQA